MKQIRLVGAATVLVVGLTALTGCAGGGTKSAQGSGTKNGGSAAVGGAVDVSSALDLVAKSTKSASTARVKMVEKLPQLGTVTASGAMGWNPMKLDMTMDMSGVKNAAQAAGSIRMLMSGTVMYMNMGDKMAQSMHGKHWFKMDIAAMAKKQGASGAQMLDQMNKAGQDPTQSVGLITSSGNVKEVGKETVNGVQATHFRGTVDITRLAEKQGALGGMTAEQRKQFEAQMTKLGVKTMDVDLWVNADNRPVRVHESGRTANGPLDITVDYSDYGTPVDIQPPAASDTVDFSKLLSGAGAKS